MIFFPRHLLLFFALFITAFSATAQRDNILDAPIILQPWNGVTVKPLQPQFMVFIWTNSGSARLPEYNAFFRYRFELVDMSANNLANPEDAFRSLAIRPYYVEDNLISPNLLYNISKPPLLEGRKYAVRVTVYGIDVPFEFRNNGKSPVIVFTYGKVKEEPGPEANKENPPPKDGGELLTPVIENQ